MTGVELRHAPRVGLAGASGRDDLDRSTTTALRSSRPDSPRDTHPPHRAAFDTSHPEGVVQFRYELTAGSPPTEPEVRDLVRCRRELFGRDVIGCDLTRYGACYGNMSARTGPWAAPPGRREFLVSGTQTGGDPVGGRELLVRVVRYDHARNLVVAQGPCPPSSETMTHGAIYDASLEVRAVVHGHDPALWRWLLAQGAPHTAEGVAYGTPAMARAARALVATDRRKPWRLAGVFAMAGHEDGVVAFGASLAQATARFVAAWEQSR